MDHLGIRQFFFFGNCIGGPFAMKLMERAPQRVVAAILSQPVGHRPEKPDYMYESGKDVWAKEFRERRPDVLTATIEQYLHNLYRVQPDFVYSVSRDFAKSCQTPMLVLPDDIVAHPLQVSIDIASLAPNAEITVFPWKEPPELKARNINRARTFLKRHQTSVAKAKSAGSLRCAFDVGDEPINGPFANACLRAAIGTSAASRARDACHQSHLERDRAEPALRG
jgi:pimeloyl-ACP methyl ester carboxylesterase